MSQHKIENELFKVKVSFYFPGNEKIQNLLIIYSVKMCK